MVERRSLVSSCSVSFPGFRIPRDDREFTEEYTVTEEYTETQGPSPPPPDKDSLQPTAWSFRAPQPPEHRHHRRHHVRHAAAAPLLHPRRTHPLPPRHGSPGQRRQHQDCDRDVSSQARLEDAGFKQLEEREAWAREKMVTQGGKYFYNRNRCRPLLPAACLTLPAPDPP